MLSLQTIHLINGFSSGVEDQHAQNIMLHGIFTRIVMYDRVEQNPSLFVETCLTLARMYWDQNWAPASVFFYILTGFMLDDNAIITLTTSSFPQLNENLRLDPANVNGMCDLHCGVLNSLWLQQDDEDSDDESDEEDFEDDDDDDDDDEKDEQCGSECSHGKKKHHHKE